jgi:cytochrome c2
MIGDGAIIGSGRISTVWSAAVSARSKATISRTSSSRRPRRGDVWTEAALDGFIANPDGYLPGTSMVFRGIRAAEDRADLIAFIIQEGGSAEAGEDTGPTPEVAAILAIEGDVAYGQYLSSECTSCHIGEGGRDIPSIRGLTPNVFIGAWRPIGRANGPPGHEHAGRTVG